MHGTMNIKKIYHSRLRKPPSFALQRNPEMTEKFRWFCLISSTHRQGISSSCQITQNSQGEQKFFFFFFFFLAEHQKHSFRRRVVCALSGQSECLFLPEVFDLFFFEKYLKRVCVTRQRESHVFRSIATVTKQQTGSSVPFIFNLPNMPTLSIVLNNQTLIVWFVDLHPCIIL